MSPDIYLQNARAILKALKGDEEDDNKDNYDQSVRGNTVSQHYTSPQKIKYSS